MTPTTALIGREHERNTVLARLAERRLVTLLGPGGIGKTALARSIVPVAAQSFPDGYRTIDLTLVDEPGEVRESLAGQLGYASFSAVLDSPGDLPVLLFVDNCEHVVDAAADVLAEILRTCEAPTVLATSRVPLGVPGEVVVPLGGLGLPDGDGAEGPAVELFVERAAEAGVSVTPSPIVAELCRRLDGIPLAIELAAARLRSMSPDDVLARLGESLDVLQRSRSRAAPRHRSLRAAIEWSWALLHPDAQQLVADLSVFAGPFDAVAAHAVGGRVGDTVADTQDRLHELVESSVLVAEIESGPAHYRLLETVRRFAQEQLDSAGRRREVERRFVDHVLAVAASIVERGAATWSATALVDLRQAYPSIATAVRWCVEHDDTPDRALLFTAVLWGLVHQAHTRQIGEIAEAVLGRWPDATHPMVADAAATAATCRYMLGDDEGAIALATAHLAHATRSPFAPATLRRAIAQATRASGDPHGAMRWFDETATAARRLGLVSMAAEAVSAQAQILADLGRLDEALARVEAAHTESTRAGSEVGTAWATAIRGSILLRRDPEEATGVLTAALRLARGIEYEAGVAVCLRSLALGDLMRGDLATAAAHTSLLLDDLLARGSTYELRMVLDLVSPLARAAGLDRAAADLAATALALPVVSITASVGHELFPLDPTGGVVLPTREAIAAAQRVLDDVRAGHRDASPEADVAGDPDTLTGEFRRVGEVWHLAYGGHDVALRASKGLADLARLLASPGREVHSLDLAGARAEQSSAGPAFDATARRRYEEEIRALHDDIEEAEAAQDGERAARARAALDQLIDHLAAGTGLGGRDRATGSTSERARSAVTQRIRATIRRIESVHPALGRHLDVSVRTGTWCSYHPDRPVEWKTA